MKFIITFLVGVTIGAYLHTYTREPIEVVELEQTLWCFYAEYNNIDNFHSTNSFNNTFIAFRNNKVMVYVPCYDLDR